jgi:hypothetical protein
MTAIFEPHRRDWVDAGSRHQDILADLVPVGVFDMNIFGESLELVSRSQKDAPWLVSAR